MAIRVLAKIFGARSLRRSDVKASSSECGDIQSSTIHKMRYFEGSELVESMEMSSSSLGSDGATRCVCFLSLSSRVDLRAVNL